MAAILGALVIPIGAGLRPHVDRLLFPERAALAEAASQLVDDLALRESPTDMAEYAANRTAAVFDARGVALYLREGGDLVLHQTRGLSPPAVLRDLRVLPARVRPRNAPSVLGSEVAIVVPVSPGNTIDALILLGPKGSDDIYTTGDAGILTTIGARIETEWLHFQKRAADHESQEKTNLLAAASHDLRQPLHTVSLLTEALEGKVDDPDVRALIGQIGDATNSLEEMLTSLLDRSQLDAGGVRPDVRDIGLNHVLTQIERDLALQARARGLRLRVVPTRLVARTDPMLLARIVRNLVSNALRHAGSGGAALLGARPRGDRIVIEVRDTGPGIPQESQREIFEAFRQLGRSRTEGLGLGLSIVDGLARVLGHEVRLRSAPGHGSTFEVWLPRASSLAAPARSDVRPAASAALPHRVLLVEDDERVRTATRALLEGWSCETREASDLAGARRALEDGWRPDFVLADYHLENGEVGLTLLDALREQLGRAVPGAIITSDTSPELHESIRAAGLPVLRKPVRPARLRAVLAARDPARGSETGSVDR